MRQLRLLIAFASACAALSSSNAFARVMQPSGEVMPRPVQANEINCCVTARGFAADAITLAGVFKYHEINGIAGGDMSIDPIEDAYTTPGTFSPQCGLSGTIVLRGGGCKNALGWYNATIPATMPTQIFPLVPADLTMPYPNGISCVATDFCPLATRATTQPNYTWANPLPDFGANIRMDNRWTGGQIGFAMIGVPNSQCPQTKYSQAELNAKNSAGMPWVTTLIYQSVADPNAYYIAFEDQPSCAGSWKGCEPGSNNPIPANVTDRGNDGDFNDFVFYVSGITCKEGGKPCVVPGAMGICATGVAECASGGTTTTCRQAVMPQPEKCDAVDNDCNGMVDDGDGLCPEGSVCDKGTCVRKCDDGEFKCLFGLTCDMGYCKDSRCIGVTCGNDQVCIAGSCIGGCDGVTCPYGQVCRVGQCVSPCDGVTCESGKVCEGGACQPPCGECRDCASATQKCSTMGPNKGACIETGCENKTCPAGQVCKAGNCQDGCTDVKCPAGQACMNGACMMTDLPDAGPPVTGTGGSSSSGIAGNFGFGGVFGGGGTTGAGGVFGAGGMSGGGGTAKPRIGGVTSCGCGVADGPGAGSAALLAFGLALAVRRRLRRR
jgi:MYXO-CTERM domain-containing protein